MGAHESLFNDTCEPVEVWWQIIGKPPHKTKGYHLSIETSPEELTPNSTATRKVVVSWIHQICVKYKSSDFDKPKTSCRLIIKVPFSRKNATFAVTDIVGKGFVPPCQDTAKAEHSALYAVEPSGNFVEPQSSLVESLVLGLVALTFLLLAATGLKKRLRFRKSGLGVQEYLMSA
eukprot:gnl/TRDRNA2_/TRDRNA2_196874_c0_seq1.p1 gnl/TRDRNA2_/TRDRNA2_196874_c0~~gnl/TRDRNA2_/TRDRNA2_196874_c0_seq1.p1  ORF type:complete len:191 (+),score=27.66 gnl/TRDRNA2_/TRDRNA2_196874_c0_seq1:51-575(+)